jgi:hypothetical protein
MKIQVSYPPMIDYKYKVGQEVLYKKKVYKVLGHLLGHYIIDINKILVAEEYLTSAISYKIKKLIEEVQNGE